MAGLEHDLNRLHATNPQVATAHDTSRRRLTSLYEHMVEHGAPCKCGDTIWVSDGTAWDNQERTHPHTCTADTVRIDVDRRNRLHRTVTAALVDALQYVWDDHCGDTHTVPEFVTLGIENGEPVAYANFDAGNFVWRVAEHFLDTVGASHLLTVTDLHQLADLATEEAAALRAQAPDAEEEAGIRHLDADHFDALAARARSSGNPA